MTVDYAEGKSLIEAWDKIGTVDTHEDLFNWFYANAEALLNPWRPISELPEEWKDGREVLLCAKPDLNFTMVGTWEPREEDSPWAWRSIEGTAHHTDCFTHFRPIEPPGGEG